jgi:hypothetical protein
MRSVLLAGAAVAAMFVSPVHAQALSGKLGTPGFGAEFSYGLSSMFAVRANVNSGSLSRDMTESGITYNGKLKLSSSALLLDLHPFSGTFRITAGLAFNNNKIDVDGSAEPGATIDIGGTTYDATQVGSLKGAIRFDQNNPYLGIGWGSKPRGDSGLFFSADLGAMFQTPTATLTGICGPALTAPACAQLQADIAEEQAELQDAVSSFKIYPVITFGIGYRF